MPSKYSQAVEMNFLLGIKGGARRYSSFQVVLRPWPNDSIFHSIFSSTFDLKVERLLRGSTFQLLIFPQRMSSEKYLLSQISARLTRRYCACFHSTSSTRWPNGSIFTQQQFFCSIFVTKIKLHSTSLDSLNKVAKRLDFC